MKKIISVVVFLVLLIWTWNVVHSTSAVGFETHSAIQQNLANMIEKTILAKKPEVQNLKITRLWTEELDHQKVLAHFTYQFSEKIDSQDTTVQTIEGEATLARDNSNDPTVDSWKLLMVKTNQDSVIFSEGSEITPQNGTTDSDSKNSAPAEENKH